MVADQFLQRYDPRMIANIVAHADAGGEGLHPNH